MGGVVSVKRSDSRVSSDPLQDHPQAMLLVNGSTRRRGRTRSSRSTSGGTYSSNPSAVRGASRRQKNTESSNDEEIQAMRAEADPATLQILNAVKEVDGLPQESASLKLQLLRDCYQLLERVPANRFDHLAVLVYQKEGDVYLAQGDVENAKITYSRAIQIAETRVARGEKEIYMVLKRYVRAMVGMARLWYEQERDTTGFTFADEKFPLFVAADENEQSVLSRESSVFSEASVFSLNQAILTSMAPRQPRRRVGPTVRAVRLPHPKTMKQQFTEEDNFVLRSQMKRELKASPCEMLLLRCIEVVEIGHRRQSELLIPALMELAQIYEDLKLYNRSLLLVRRCLGILSVVYDYDHPWIIQLRHRADYLIEMMEKKLKESMATKIKATWKMHREMRLLEEVLGRPVKRHVWIPRQGLETQLNASDFLREFVNDLPDGTVLCGVEDWDEAVDTPPYDEDEAQEGLQSRSVSNGLQSLTRVVVENVNQQVDDANVGPLHLSTRRPTLVMSESEKAAVLSDDGVQQVVQKEVRPTMTTTHVSGDERVVDLSKNSQPVVYTSQTGDDSRLAIHTTTTTTTVVREIIVDDREEGDIYEDQREHVGNNVVKTTRIDLTGLNDQANQLKTVKTKTTSFFSSS